MKPFHALLGSTVVLSSVLAACAAGPDDETDDRVDEVVDQTSSALQNSTGLSGSQCTSCGCTLEKMSGPDDNGCRTYRCVCDSTAKAKCVTGKTSAVSSAAAAQGTVRDFSF